MIKKSLKLFLLALLLMGCSGGKISYYENGDLTTRQFLDHTSQRSKIRGDYFEVKRDKKGQITSAKYFSSGRIVAAKSNYIYNRKGILIRHQLTEFFDNGPPRLSKEWSYKNGKIVEREDQWFTRSHQQEKKLTIHYDALERPYLEQTWGLASKIESSTEYYYDYYKRLDKSRRNFFLPDGQLRDYWITIYNDDNQITNEDHYLYDNSLISFYRYSYHPVNKYRELEEIFDESDGIFTTRRFDEYGLILSEEIKDRNLNLVKKTVYEYNDKHGPKLVHQYNASGKLVKSSKYKLPVYLKKFRTPGI